MDGPIQYCEVFFNWHIFIIIFADMQKKKKNKIYIKNQTRHFMKIFFVIPNFTFMQRCLNYCTHFVKTNLASAPQLEYLSHNPFDLLAASGTKMVNLFKFPLPFYRIYVSMKIKYAKDHAQLPKLALISENN